MDSGFAINVIALAYNVVNTCIIITSVLYNVDLSSHQAYSFAYDKTRLQQAYSFTSDVTEIYTI